MGNEFDELIQVEWSNIVDRADDLAKRCNSSSDVFALMLAFAMAADHIDGMTPVTVRQIAAAMIAAWERSK